MKPSSVILVYLCFVLVVSARRKSGASRKPVSNIINIDDAHDEVVMELEASGSGADGTDIEAPEDNDASGDETEEPSGDVPEGLAGCLVIRAKSLNGAMTNSARPVRIGLYVPECTPDGQFKPTQCHASSGECWCVDQLGVEQAGSRRQAPQKPTCSPSDAETVMVSSATTAASSEHLASTTSKILLKTFSSTSLSTQISVKTSMSSTGTSTARPGSLSTVRYTTTRTSTATSSTTRAVDPDNKINQIPDATGPDIEVDGPDTDNNYVERPNVIIEHKTRKMTLRSTIVGQPGILAGIIGAAVVVLLCLVLLVMFIIYRMHRKSQDPAIYYIDKPARSSLPSSNKKGYMKALDHDVYT